MKYLMLIRMQIKAAFKYLPRILLGMVIFGFITVLIMTASVYVSENASDNDKMSVAVVVDDNAGMRERQYVKTAFSYIQEMDSVNSVCTFSDEYTYDMAYRLLREGKLTAVIRIPAGFIDGILYGKNIPAVVLFNGGSSNITGMLLKYMMQAGATDLSTAQAGIYAFDDIYISMYGVDEAQKTQENSLNKAYLSYALDRGGYFKTLYTDSDTGINTLQSYVCSAIVLLLMFTTITCVGFFNKDKRIVVMQLKRSGMVKEAMCFSKVTGLSVVISVICVPVYILTMLSTIRYYNMRDVIMLKNADNIQEFFRDGIICVFAVIFMIFCIYIFAGAILSCFPEMTAGILVLFVIIILTTFAGGLIIPLPMLPDVIRKASVYMPPYWYHKLASQIITGTVTIATLSANLVYAVLSAAVIIIAERIRR